MPNDLQMIRVLELLNVEPYYQTGGGCTAHRYVIGASKTAEDGRYMLITIKDDPSAPDTLEDGPVSVGIYDDDENDCDSVGGSYHATLADALYEIFGDEYESALQDADAEETAYLRSRGEE